MQMQDFNKNLFVMYHKLVGYQVLHQKLTKFSSEMKFSFDIFKHID